VLTPFLTESLADSGPLERGTPTAPEPRARDAREFERQAEWRAAAARAIEHSVDEPSPAAEAERDDDDEDVIQLDGTAESPIPLETLTVLGFGLSRKKLEQAVRELGLPVVVVRDIEDANAVITLRNYYKQKPPALRDAEAAGIPIYVLKSNTLLQMEACLTALFAVELDPSELALREVEEAIGLVRTESKPVELSPQNAYVRRLQHQAAERANLLSRSRGREPYRRVRLYPDKARAWR
jgi:hypothetical protein